MLECKELKYLYFNDESIICINCNSYIVCLEKDYKTRLSRPKEKYWDEDKCPNCSDSCTDCKDYNDWVKTKETVSRREPDERVCKYCDHYISQVMVNEECSQARGCPLCKEKKPKETVTRTKF